MRHAHKSKSRIVGYRFEGHFDQLAAEKVLQRAEKAGVITQGVAKMYADGGVVWFDGWPGAELRAVRDQIEEMLR